MIKKIKLGNRLISTESKPYVIAEIGVNHEGSVKNAKRLIELAKRGGADAAKFQSYKAGTLASKNSPSYWDTSKEQIRSQYDLFKKYDGFEPCDFIELANYCSRLEIDFLSTPFDDAAIEFLDPIVPFFKIASADLTNTPFLRKIAAKGKPIVLSTGASTLAEIDGALKTIRETSACEIALLHCILNYPTENANANLRMITGLKKVYPDCVIGYSDHTLPDETMTSLVAAYSLGAVIIEKHFTHDKSLQGNDHYHAMDVIDLSRFIEMINKIDILYGHGESKAPIKSEEISRINARRSIVINFNLPAGHIISAQDITYKRPGTGISPLYWDDVLGMRLLRAVEADHVLQWCDLEK